MTDEQGRPVLLNEGSLSAGSVGHVWGPVTARCRQGPVRKVRPPGVASEGCTGREEVHRGDVRARETIPGPRPRSDPSAAICWP